MRGATYAQRQRRAQRDLINEASRSNRGLTVYPAAGPSIITNPRVRDRVARPGGKLPAGTSTKVRRQARRLADELIEGGLANYVSQRRAAGQSWRRISLDILAEVDLDIHPATLKQWCSEDVAA